MATPTFDKPLVPHAEVLIDGSALPANAQAHVASITAALDTDLIGMFALELTGSDDQQAAVPWVDDALFSIGNGVEIKLGYVDNVETVMVGEIVALEPVFAFDRLPSVTVRGFDRRHRLARGRRTRTFVQQKDSDIAAQIAGEAGLTAQATDSAVVHDYVLQANQSDLEFLQERARRIHFEVVVEDQTFYFRPIANDAAETLTLTMESDLLEFRPRLSALRQVTEVTVRGWDPKQKTALVGSAKAGDEVSVMAGQSSGPAASDSAFGAAPGLVGDRPVATQAEADQLAKGRFNTAALGYVTGEATCLGRTDVHPGSVIKLDGIGQRFSGVYYVAGVKHHYTAQRGYLTDLSLRRNAA